ncbi:dihydrofolate reductase [Streptomyces griseoaurantiacus]|uniref:dihydrofolate reductase n=1 Tax=Streptomyces griseoaurantiacus TaxID=68213 RepID=A0A1G7FKB6_9ACTN|nr:dihydrofolate reductase [Streptomyces jietaisiensis]SDE76338.1 dihydrofolate reductase [Streptomyces jietaisiensis]
MITSLIVAAAENDVIGVDGDLPWHIPGDLRHFKRLTQGHAVVLGRLTHESILARLGRPLPRRTNVVVSRSPHPQNTETAGSAGTTAGTAGATGTPETAAGSAAHAGGVRWERSVAEALATAEALERAAGTDEVCVIGGASVYRQALPFVDRVHLTRVHLRVEGDTRMPEGWLEGFEEVSRLDVPAEGPVPAHSFLRLERPPR